MSASPETLETQAAKDQMLLERIAQRIVRLHLETPCVFFLELHLPVVSLLQTASVVAAPLMTPLFQAERIHTLQSILSSRRNIETLISLIEKFRDGHTSLRAQD